MVGKKSRKVKAEIESVNSVSKESMERGRLRIKLKLQGFQSLGTIPPSLVQTGPTFEGNKHVDLQTDGRTEMTGL